MKNENAPETKRTRKAKPAEAPAAQASVAPEAASEAAAPKTITLFKRITEKGGVTSYARPGVRASIYFAKGMFADGVPPESITLIADPHFAEPVIKPAVDVAAVTAAASARADAALAKAQAKVKAEAPVITPAAKKRIRKAVAAIMAPEAPAVV